jgi:hypothetical protein
MMTELLSKDHTILERQHMLFRPFGQDERGEKIADITGMIVCATVDYLQECVSRRSGEQAAAAAMEELCRQLNERIRDAAYHVTPEFLKKNWNGYSYEFVCYLREFCLRIAGDPGFIFNAARAKKVSSRYRILGRPFSVAQIYQMYPHFTKECASKDSVEVQAVKATDGLAVLRLRFTDRAIQQFGPYVKRCAELTCSSAKGGLSSIPQKIHDLQPATVSDLTCMANGDEWCEWEITWREHAGTGLIRSLKRVFRGGAR